MFEIKSSLKFFKTRQVVFYIHLHIYVMFMASWKILCHQVMKVHKISAIGHRYKFSSRWYLIFSILFTLKIIEIYSYDLYVHWDS